MSASALSAADRRRPWLLLAPSLITLFVLMIVPIGIMTIFSFYEFVTAGVEKILAELKPGLPGVDMDSTIFRPATFIQLSIDHLTEALWLGCLLVVVVLWFFLGDWRTTVNGLIEDWCWSTGVARSALSREDRLAIVADLGAIFSD